MSESLVRSGAPVVLGWALPVDDQAASLAAAALYRDLAVGHDAAHAVALARRELVANDNASWHLLRAYTDASPIVPVVTPLNTAGRARVHALPAADEFLDPATGTVKVASRQGFRGRRRIIQRCLRHLQRPTSDPGGREGLLLCGMGGLGKSTLASRLAERLPVHRRAVVVGRVAEQQFLSMVEKIDFDSLNAQREAGELLNAPDASLEARIRYLLRGPLAATPVLFIFDDFENGNLDERDHGYVCTAAANEILTALLSAIRSTNSRSRAVITSRYAFEPPTGTRIATERLETLDPNELAKKLLDLDSLRPGSPTDPTIRARAIDAAAGNPRLLEWLDQVIGESGTIAAEVLEAIGDTEQDFREHVLAEALVAKLPSSAQRMLALVNLVELPIPFETVAAMSGEDSTSDDVRLAANLGLLEAGHDPSTGHERYLVSNVLRPLVQPLLDDEQRRSACAAAARSLYEIWLAS